MYIFSFPSPSIWDHKLMKTQIFMFSFNDRWLARDRDRRRLHSCVIFALMKLRCGSVWLLLFCLFVIFVIVYQTERHDMFTICSCKILLRKLFACICIPVGGYPYLYLCICELAPLQGLRPRRVASVCLPFYQQRLARPYRLYNTHY